MPKFQHQGRLRQEDQEIEACLVYRTRSVSGSRSRVRLGDYISVDRSIPVGQRGLAADWCEIVSVADSAS